MMMKVVVTKAHTHTHTPPSQTHTHPPLLETMEGEELIRGSAKLTRLMQGVHPPNYRPIPLTIEGRFNEEAITRTAPRGGMRFPRVGDRTFPDLFRMTRRKVL